MGSQARVCAREDYLLDSGWNVRQLLAAAAWCRIPEIPNALGKGKKYAAFAVPGGAYMFPAYDLNHAYQDTDVFVSMAKLKNHETCGVTLSMKNCFGNLPASIYGDDAGVDEPNENPTSGRLKTMHGAWPPRQPSKSALRNRNWIARPAASLGLSRASSTSSPTW